MYTGRLTCLHSVVFAQYNAILLIDTVDIQDTYEELMSKLVCLVDSADCMTHRYEKCPGNDNLRNYLKNSTKSKRFRGRIRCLVFNIIGLYI